MFHTKEIKMLIDKVGENALEIEELKQLKKMVEEEGDLWTKFKDITTKVNRLTKTMKDMHESYVEANRIVGEVQSIKREIIQESIQNLEIVVKVKK